MKVNFIEERKSLFPSVYLTLMSVIQASVFGFFLYIISEKISYINHLDIFGLVDFILTVVILISLLIITWNEYMMFTTTFVWMPGFADSAFSFLTGIVEALTIFYAFELTPTWYFVFASFALFSFWIYWIFYSKAEKFDENSDVFKIFNAGKLLGFSLRALNYYSMLVMFVFLVLMGVILWAVSNVALIDLIFKILVTAMGIGFGIKTYVQWSIVTNYVRKR